MADEDGDDFETDMDDDAGTEGDDDAGTEGDEGDTDDPAELKKRLAKQAAALKKANAQAARLRAAAKKAAPAKKAARPAESAQEGAETGRAAEDADARFTRHAIRTEGAAAILEAGFNGDRKAARELTKLLDSELLDVDEDGEVDGLDEAVEELVEKYPGLFAKQESGAGRQQAPRKRVQSIDSAAGGRSTRRGAGNQAGQSSAERIGAMLRKGA